MDRERAYLVATPFKRRGKRSLKISDFIFTLSLDIKWGPPDKVRALILEAEKEGMVKVEGEMIHASFDEKELEIPIGFKPQPIESFFERVVRQVISKTEMSQKEVIALINERQDALQRLVELDAVALLVAGELGIDVKGLAQEAYQNLLANKDKGQTP